MEAGDIENITGPGLNMTTGQPILNMTAGQPMLKTVHDYLLVVLLVAVMFAMGCHITWEQVCKFILIISLSTVMNDNFSIFKIFFKIYDRNC